MNDDAHLLRQFSRDGSEQAFRELVQRYIPLVNATARRMAGNDIHLAQDITQLVFTDLARKAASLPDNVLLGGWLHRHTCFTASKTIRAERRRRAREKTAMEMNTLHDNPSNDAQWAQIAPVLDDALNSLSAADREAILLRHFQRLDLRAVGRALGTSDDTAQKRITRALEKLRSILTRRGLTLSTALLATTLNAGAAPPVPATLAITVSTHALTNAAAATGFTLASLYTMITSKLALSAAAVLTLTGVATVLIAQNDAHDQSATVLASTQSAQPSTAPTPENPKPDALVSRIFDLPADTLTFMTAFANVTANANDTSDSIKNALIHFGVNFPTGSSLLYNPVLHQIAVTDTPENLQMVDKVLTEFSESNPTPSNPFSAGNTPAATPNTPPSQGARNLMRFSTLKGLSQNAPPSQGAVKPDAFNFHTYAMSPATLNSLLAKNPTSPPVQQPGSDDIKNALIKLGVGFPPGSGLLYNQDAAKIAVFNTPANQAKIAALLAPNPFASTNTNPTTSTNDTLASNTSTATNAPSSFQPSPMPIAAGKGNTFGPPPPPSVALAQPIRNDQSLTDKYLNKTPLGKPAADIPITPPPNDDTANTPATTNATSSFQPSPMPIAAGKGNLTFGPAAPTPVQLLPFASPPPVRQTQLTGSPSSDPVSADPRIPPNIPLTMKYAAPGMTSANPVASATPVSRTIFPNTTITVIMNGYSNDGKVDSDGNYRATSAPWMGVSRDAKVDGDGNVKLPYLRIPLQVANLTTDQAAQIISKEYESESSVTDLKVVVGIKQPDPHVNVIGQVNKPGPVTISLDHPLTLVEAIALAGGHNRIAAHVVTITRHTPDGKTTTIDANLYKAMSGDTKENIELKDGDTVYVDESKFGW